MHSRIISRKGREELIIENREERKCCWFFFLVTFVVIVCCHSLLSHYCLSCRGRRWCNAHFHGEGADACWERERGKRKNICPGKCCPRFWLLTTPGLQNHFWINSSWVAESSANQALGLQNNAATPLLHCLMHLCTCPHLPIYSILFDLASLNSAY